MLRLGELASLTIIFILPVQLHSYPRSPRRRDERADPNNNWKKDVPIKNDMQPVPAVHVDVTRDRGQQQTLLAYEGSGYTEKDRIARL